VLIKYMLRAATVALLALTVSACTSGGEQAPGTPGVSTNQPTQGPTPSGPTGKVGRANVESLDIKILESFPVQVQVTIKGTVSDACTTAGPIEQGRDGNSFLITVGANRPADAMCAQVITPFEQTIALDVAGLKAGTYAVEVNGVTETFQLAADNVMP
jgi:inhibitor of cysteine peptidase